MVAVFVRATVSRTEMLADVPLETKALSRFGVMAMRIGKVPTGIWVTTWLVEVSITATSSEYLAGQKRNWAKAEEAKAKAKIINSKGRRYVFMVKAGIRPSSRTNVKPNSNLWKPLIQLGVDFRW